MTTNRILASLAVASFAVVGIASSPIASASSPLEDQAGWSCVDDGNRICGPDNSNGVPAGCYDDGGVLVAAWPCYIVVNSMGDADIYTR